MATFNREDPRTALPQLEKKLTEMIEGIDGGLFIAEYDKTTFKEVRAALLDGKLPFAITTNSYGTFNAYPYTFTGTDSIVFGRTHGINSPQYRIVRLYEDDTWTTTTINLATA